MSRDQMRNLEAFKIGSSQVNEFEYQKNQGQMTEQLEQHPDEAAKGAKGPTQAERVKQIMADAHKKVVKKRKKAGAKAKARKPARKAAARKTVGGKSSAAVKTSKKSSKKAGKRASKK